MTVKTEEDTYTEFIKQLAIKLLEISGAEQLLSAFLTTVIHVTGMEMAAIHLYNATTGKLEVTKSINVPEDVLHVIERLSPYDGVVGTSFSESRMLFYNRTAHDNQAMSVVSNKVGTVIAIPMKHRDLLIGVLAIASKKSVSNENFDKPFLESITRQMGDLIESLRQDKELSSALRMISYNERIIKNIIQNLPSGVMYINGKGEILLFNTVMEQITGIKADDIINRTADEFIKLIKLSGFDYREVIKYAVVKKRVDSLCTLPDGREGNLGFTMAPITDANGKGEGVIALFADLIEIKQKEKEQHQLMHLALVGEMAARLAHEIRNPLSSIIIGIQLQKKRTSDIADNRNLDMIISEIQRIEKLIKTMLTYSKTAVPRMEPVNAVSLIKNALTVMFPRLSHYNIKVEQHIPENADLTIIADHAAIHQVLINIINNAIDAMPKGGTLTIDAVTTGAQTPHTVVSKTNSNKYYQQELEMPEMVKIDIQDTGSGIESIYLGKIFTPFFSTKAKGVGLGLSIVKNVIDENMGRITVSSIKDKGTMFSLYFLKGTRQRCYEVINCPANERNKCEIYLKGDVYRCFKYKDADKGCCNILCIDCAMYKNGVVPL